MQDVIIPAVPGKKSDTVAKTEEIKTKTTPTNVEATKIPDEFFEDDEKILRIACIAGLAGYFVAVIFLSVSTDSSLFNTMLGLSPILFTLVVTYVLVDKYHMESGFLMIFPFIFTGILLLLGFAKLLGGIDYLTLASVNIMAGLAFEAILVMLYSTIHRHTRPEKVEEDYVFDLDDEAVKKLVSSIEDKAKAINSVIGRVYSVRKGGTESMRKKIRIDSLQYNELSSAKENEDRRVIVRKLVMQIKESLDLIGRPESEVFENDEMYRLVRLKRDAFGQDKVIDVLAKNDSDPVKDYYNGALEFCNDTIKKLK